MTKTVKKHPVYSVLFLIFLLIVVMSAFYTLHIRSATQPRTLRLALFDGGLGTDFWQEIIEEFEASHPDIQIEATTDIQIGNIIRNQIASGNPPDLVDLSDSDPSGLVNDLISNHQLVELTDVFEENVYDGDTPLKTLIGQNLLSARKFSPYGDEKIYLAPKYHSPAGLVYNKALFREKGWKLPVTWEDFFALGEMAREEGIALLVYPGIYPYYQEDFLLACFANNVEIGGMENIFSYTEGSFNTEAVLEVASQVERLGKESYILEGSSSMNNLQAQQEMINGNALFVPSGTWIETEMQSTAGGDFEYGMLPGLSTDSKNTEADTFVYHNTAQLFIPEGAKNVSDAKEFLRFFYSQVGIRALTEKGNSISPAVTDIDSIKDSLSPAQYEMFELLQTHTPIIPDFYPLAENSKMDVYEFLYGERGAGQVLSGEMTAAQWVEEVEKGFAQIRRENAH